jgi:hypothetical protein
MESFSMFLKGMLWTNLQDTIAINIKKMEYKVQLTLHTDIKDIAVSENSSELEWYGNQLSTWHNVSRVYTLNPND